MDRDPYVVLGVPRGASLEEVKRAYRRLAKETHPDLGASAADVERFHRVQRAYRELRRSLHARAEAGATPASAPPPPSPSPTPPPPRRPAEPERSAWIDLKREEAALATGRRLENAVEIRPRRLPTLALQSAVSLVALATTFAPRESWWAIPDERRGLLLALILVLLALAARNAWLHLRHRDRVCLTDIGLYIVEGRRVTAVPLGTIQQIDFGYDPITRFGFRPFSLRLHVALDRAPIRIPSCYGERELRTLAGWTYDRSRGVRAS